MGIKNIIGELQVNGSPVITEETMGKVSSFSGSYDDLTNVPQDFPPSKHSHPINNIDGLQDKLNSIQSNIDVLIGDYSEGLAYALVEGTYRVNSIGTCTDTDIIIPPIYNGIPVTRIKNHAFSGNNLITSVTIPDSVTSISNSAFKDCTSLSSVVIGDSVTTIEQMVFYNCSSLSSVVIPDSVTTVGEWAFSPNTIHVYCEATSQPEGWDTNWNDYNCPVTWGFANDFISVNEKVGDILTLTTTAKTVVGAINEINDKSINKYSESLAYSISSDNTSYIVSGIGTCTDTDITIPRRHDGKPIAGIRQSAFYNCSSLTSVVIPDSVTSIGSGAFLGCTNLSSVIIPDSVASIGNSAFYPNTVHLYCEATSQPEGWDTNWNGYNCPVTWGFANDFISVNEKIDDIPSIPNCDSTNNGQFLRVVNGIPTWSAIPIGEEATF